MLNIKPYISICEIQFYTTTQHCTLQTNFKLRCYRQIIYQGKHVEYNGNILVMDWFDPH